MKIHLLTQGCPIVLTLFIEKIALSSLNDLCKFVRNQLFINLVLFLSFLL